MIALVNEVLGYPIMLELEKCKDKPDIFALYVTLMIFQLHTIFQMPVNRPHPGRNDQFFLCPYELYGRSLSAVDQFQNFFWYYSTNVEKKTF